MKNTRKIMTAVSAFILLIMVIVPPAATYAKTPKMRMTTDIPAWITTPDKVKTRIGTLEYFDGFPTKKTSQKLYDYLDLNRGVNVFLNCLPIASLMAMREGYKTVGVTGNVIGIFENLMDSKSLFLTPNTESIYAGAWLDLSKGPVVVESPPNTLGIVDDFWFNYVADMGNAGPDQGRGGRFLFLPPDHEGPVPAMGFHVFKSNTYNNVLIWRGFTVNGDPKPGVENIKKHAKIYPLAQIQNPPQQKFINLSGVEFSTIHANDYHFFEEVNMAIQDEPAGSGDPEILGLLASIGIKKGQNFNPDDRMKKILSEAASIGNGIARSFIFQTREKSAYLYENSSWKTAFIGGSHQFLNDGVRLLDARAMFFYYATMITPAMVMKMVGTGSQYAMATTDVNGNILDGSKQYTLHFPKDLPVKDFWSIVVYDNQTRSMLQTDQRFPSLNSERGVKPNADGSYDIYFGPNAPEGKEGNWIQTVPGKGWNVILRFYGPLESWFDQTWRPGEIELVK